MTRVSKHRVNKYLIPNYETLESPMLRPEKRNTGILKCNVERNATDVVLPAEVQSWRILVEEEDESVWSTDEYICTNIYGKQNLKDCFTPPPFQLFMMMMMILYFLPYFLLDCGPYFLAARDALSMM